MLNRGGVEISSSVEVVPEEIGIALVTVLPRDWSKSPTALLGRNPTLLPANASEDKQVEIMETANNNFLKITPC